MRRLMWRLGRKIYLNARGDIANDIESNGEATLQAHILDRAAQVGTSCNILDIGANLGLWTQAITRQAETMKFPHDKLKIYSFEPVPTTRKILIENLKPNREKFDIEIIPVAMSNENGHHEMTINGETSGSNSLEADPNAKASAELINIEVQTQTLTDFAQNENIETFHFIKCDTEGHDASVIDGARPLLEQGRVEVFQFEYNHRWVYARRYLKDIFDLIETLNVPYTLARLAPKNLEVYETWHPEMERFFESNYAIVRSDVLPSLQAHFGTYDAANTYA